MIKYNILNLNELNDCKNGGGKLLFAEDNFFSTDLQRIEMSQITQGLPAYTEPWIYYGCSNRGNRGKPRVNMNRDWYVMYQFRHPTTGEMKKFIVKDLINTFNLVEDKMKAAEIVRRVVSRRLFHKFNPFTFGREEQKSEDIAEVMEDTMFSRGLSLAMKEKIKLKEMAGSSLALYERDVKRMVKAISKNGLDLPAAKFSRKHVKGLLSYLTDSPHRYNFLLAVISSLAEEMIEWEMIEVDPTIGIKRKKIPKPEMHEPLTPEEKEIISSSLIITHPGYHLYLFIEWATGTRPDEIANIEGEDRELNGFWLDPEEQTSKKKYRFVPTNAELSKRMNDVQVPEGYYLFGKKFEPGPQPISEAYARAWWDRLVRKGLGINKTMYSYKHTGATDRDKAGLSIEDNRDLMGHASVQTTQRYIKHKKRTLTEKDKALAERVSKINLKF